MAGVEIDNQFYMTLVTVQVGNCLFRVPRQSLESKSRVFRDMFSLPIVGDGEGSSNEKPIHLDGVTKEEFKRFLEVLCMGVYEVAPTQSSVFDTWFPVFRLAHMWEFDAIRKYAVKNLPYEQVLKTTVAKVKLATQYDIDAWLLPVLNELARRREPLGNHDLEILGPELALKVAAIRESLAIRWDRTGRSSIPKLASGSRNASKVDFTPVIKEVFRISG